MQRRKFLKLAVTGFGAVFAAVVGIPAALTALSPVLRRERGPVWCRIGRVNDFTAGNVMKAVVEAPPFDWAQSLKTKAVYVLRPSDAAEFVVFSRNCTDLSCPITWDPGSERFFCPCHGGIFSKTGERVAGPPKRPLYRYAYRIVNGQVEIDLASLPPMT